MIAHEPLHAAAASRVEMDSSGASRQLDARLWAYARSLGATAEDADDAVQEALERMVRTRARGSQVEDDVAWLYTVVRRIVVDQWRWRERAQRAIARLAARRESLESAEMPEPHDPHSAVWRAVAALPERQREAVYLRYCADLSFRDVAGVMRVSEGAARGYVSKALDDLEHQLSQGGESDGQD